MALPLGGCHNLQQGLLGIFEIGCAMLAQQCRQPERFWRLHTVLEYAVSQDWIAANPARAVKVIGPRNEGSKKIVPPHKAELSRIIMRRTQAFG
jgi:hypothetical protein